MKIMTFPLRGATVALVLTLTISLVSLVAATLNIEAFESHLPLLTALSIAGMVIFAFVLCVSGINFYRRLKRRVPGTQMSFRLVRGYALLMLSCICIFYFFAYLALNRGVVAETFVQIDKALADGVLLSSVSVDAWKDVIAGSLDEVGAAVASSPDLDPADVGQLLNRVLKVRDLSEVVYLKEFSSPANAIVATSEVETSTLQPLIDGAVLDDSVLSQVGIGDPVWKLEKSDEASDLRWRIIMKFQIEGSPERFFLTAMAPIPGSFQLLGDRIKGAQREYLEYQQLVDQLRFNLTLVLTLVSLFLLLLSTWVAMQFSDRAVKPIRILSEGTQAVASGDYEKHLELDSSDDIGVLVDSFNDMTRRIKSATDEVQASRSKAEEQQAYLETVLTHLSSGVIMVDSEKRVADLNLSAVKILKVDAEEVKDMPLERMTELNPDLKPFCDFVSEGVDSGKAEFGGTVVVATGDGDLSWLCSATRLPGYADADSRYVLVIEDVSVMFKAERVAAWGEVAQRFAHEVANPLTPITLTMEQVERRVRNKDSGDLRSAIEKMLPAIFRQLRSMNTTVRQFRNYANITQIDPQEVDLNALVKETAESYEAEPRIDAIAMKLDPAVGNVRVDPDRMTQVVNNLIINSSRAMIEAESREIQIHTRRISKETIEISVMDNGPGFNPKQLGQIFDSYKIAERKGTGLGLAIVHRIISEHGGTVTARNRPEGGAEVLIRIRAPALDSDARRETFAQDH